MSVTELVYKQNLIDPALRIQKLVDVWERVLKNRFLIMVLQIKKTTVLDDLIILIGQGRFTEAIRTAETHVAAFGNEINRSFLNSATSTERLLNDKFNLLVSFDATNDRAVRLMRNNRLRFIREFTTEQIASTRQALIRGIELGLNPRVQARAFRDSIGLTARQESAVANYRRLLIENNADVLQRRLRDKRFDPTVRRAIRTGDGLTREQVNRMTARYRQRFINFRAETIGRTEALSTVHEGNHAMYQQAAQQGKIDPTKTIRTWHIAGDDRVRDSHDAMTQQEVIGIDEPFISGQGNFLMYPGDRNAPATETLQCRCAVSTRVERIQ